MKTREEIASSIERSIGTAIPTLFFSDDDLRVIVQALREPVPEEGTFKDAIELAAQHVEKQIVVWDTTNVPPAHILQTVANNIRHLKPEFMNNERSTPQNGGDTNG